MNTQEQHEKLHLFVAMWLKCLSPAVAIIAPLITICNGKFVCYSK